MRALFLIMVLLGTLWSAERHFGFYELKGKEAGSLLFIIGGVHGDEPGGYFAPALITQHYRLQKGSLWVVPNLNFDSIVENRRGIYGDMNRKFASIKRDDKDYEIVKDIKKLILDSKVDFVINLHDGHGFYRSSWENSIFNPKAWGQAYIIDQKNISDVKFGNLDEIASKISRNLNQNLSKDHHSFNIKNTNTQFKDEEMQTSLTYFAITNLKPALAIETSKNISELDQKVFYQLQSIEELMKIMGIEYERDFELTLQEIDRLLEEHGEMSLNGHIALPLEGIRSTLRFVPMLPKGNSFSFSHPLGAIKERADHYEVMIGNRSIAKLYPQRFSGSCAAKGAEVIVDGVSQRVAWGERLLVKERFLVKEQAGVRVNVIGLVTSGRDSQDEVEVKKGMIASRFSLDEKERRYRVEFYSEEGFCGMITAWFEP